MGFISGFGQLLFLTSIFLINFMARITPSPLMPQIEADLGLKHAAAGSFFLIISAGYFVSLLCSGFLSSKITHRRTIIISAVAVGLALLGASLSSSILQIRISLLLLGLMAGLYLPSGIATLSALVKPEHWGKAVAVHELAPNLSFVITPLVAEALMRFFSWHGVLACLGIASIVLGLTFAKAGKSGKFYGEAPNITILKNLFRIPAFWILLVLFSLGIGSTLGIYTMLPLYLVTEHGMDRSLANTLVAFSRVSGIIMALVAGYISDRSGPKKTLSGVFLITGFLTILLGMVKGNWIPIIVFLQPVIAVCSFPPGFALLFSLAPPSGRNVVVSFTAPAAFVIGGGAIPTFIGFAGDVASFGLGIASVGALILAAGFLPFILKVDPAVGE